MPAILGFCGFGVVLHLARSIWVFCFDLGAY